MRYGVSLPAFGDYSDPRVLAQAAQAAEMAGWDGFFIWDHLVFDPTFHPMLDPWVGLAAVALNTSHLRLGTLVTPLARRRPWKLARETVSLDILSGGRLILGVGLGDPAAWDFGWFGEDTDPKRRGQRLDEGLAVLAGLWSGEPFRYQGKHFQVEEVIFRPRPAQSPRIPIWVGGWWPNTAPLRRAARWDGTCMARWGEPLTPTDWRAILAAIAERRTSGAPFDAVHSGRTPGKDLDQGAAIAASYAEAGVTWWIEDITPWRFGFQFEDPWSPEATRRMDERIKQGPPRHDSGVGRTR